MTGRPPASPVQAPDQPSFLSSLAPADRLALEEAGVRRELGRGEVLMAEGTASSSVVVLVRGIAKVTKVATDGREALIELRGPGDLLGELGVIDGAPRSATVTPLTPVTALVVPALRFRALLAERAALANAALEVVVGRVRRASDRQLEQTAADAAVRVSIRLLELAAAFGHPGGPAGAVEVDSPISQQELADWVGLSRDGVVRALTQLRRDGLVETSRHRFTLLDPARLAERVSSSR